MPAPHLLPQAPQLSGAVWVLVQPEEQQVGVEPVQAGVPEEEVLPQVHLPELQLSLFPHTVPQVPQLVVPLFRSTHPALEPGQQFGFVGVALLAEQTAPPYWMPLVRPHWQVLATQVSLPPHLMSQSPQLLGSIRGFTQ